MDTMKQIAILYFIEKGVLTNDKEGNLYWHGHKLAPIVLPNGYLQYGLSIGFQDRLMVYGQIANYLCKYREPYNPALVIDHINKDKKDNKPENLRAITQAENLKGDWRNGSRQFVRKRLTPDEKETAKKLFNSGHSLVSIAKTLKTTRQTIAKLVK